MNFTLLIQLFYPLFVKSFGSFSLWSFSSLLWSTFYSYQLSSSYFVVSNWWFCHFEFDWLPLLFRKLVGSPVSLGNICRWVRLVSFRRGIWSFLFACCPRLVCITIDWYQEMAWQSWNWRRLIPPLRSSIPCLPLYQSLKNIWAHETCLCSAG